MSSKAQDESLAAKLSNCAGCKHWGTCQNQCGQFSKPRNAPCGMRLKCSECSNDRCPIKSSNTVIKAASREPAQAGEVQNEVRRNF